MDIEDCFFTIPSLYEKIKKTINLKSILSQSLIIQNERYDTRIFLNSICQKNNIQLKPTLQVDRHGLIIEFVKEGLGIGFATKEYIKPYLDSNELVEIKVDFNIDKRFIKCVHKSSNIKIKNFIELLNKNIKKQ